MVLVFEFDFEKICVSQCRTTRRTLFGFLIGPNEVKRNMLEDKDDNNEPVENDTEC